MAVNMAENKALSIQHMEIEESPGPSKAELAAIDIMLLDTERAPEARGQMSEDIPPGYWTSARFLGTLAALCLAKDCGSGGFGLSAPILSSINKDIGPDPDVVWVSLSWTVTQGVAALIVGRLSDVFGRRWIFISGSMLGTVGAIFASQAQTIPQLIGATVLIGLAAGSQISNFWIVSEIVPMKYRYLANSLCWLTSFTTWMGPKIAYSFQTETTVGWRGNYYLLTAMNATSALLWYLFYHPPTFKMLHRRKALTELLRSFDWFGLVLYTGSFIVFLMGLNWGGGRYPWKSTNVIASILVGAIGLVVFLLWEIWLPRRSKGTIIPFLEMHFFTNFQLMALTLMTAIAASTYYGFGSIWPGVVKNIYTGLGNTRTANMLCLVVLHYIFAQMTGGLIAHFTGPKPVIIVSMLMAAPLLACVAINPFNMVQTSVLISLGAFSLGIMEGVALTTTTYPLRTQEEIGTAGGVTNTIRLFISSIATVVYNTVLSNRLKTTIPSNVGSAAAKAGLPVSSVSQLIISLQRGVTLNSTTVPGINPSIATAAKVAYRVAYSEAYRTVFLTSIAFIAPGMVLCWFIAQNDRKKDEFIAGMIHQTGEEKGSERQDE